jgi:surfactin synthase thioesterase subunit
VGTGTRLLVRPLPRPQAGRALVCIGYSGGGTAPFRRWAPLLPEDTELVLVCYPGREGRFGEPFATDWDELCDEVVDALAKQIERPFVLFGHSMGAAMAFEVAARLERSGRGPTGLVVSASESPTDWQEKIDRPPSARQSDEELLEWMTTVGQLPREFLAEPELVAIAIDLLRADLAVSASYRYVPGTTVRAPMQVLYGVDDGRNAEAQAKRWVSLAAGEVTVDELPGGHFYVPEIWAALPERFAALAT